MVEMVILVEYFEALFCGRTGELVDCVVRPVVELDKVKHKLHIRERVGKATPYLWKTPFVIASEWDSAEPIPTPKPRPTPKLIVRIKLHAAAASIEKVFLGEEDCIGCFQQFTSFSAPLNASGRVLLLESGTPLAWAV